MLERSRWIPFSLGISTFGLIALLDLLTPEALSFAFFYLIPIAVLAWFPGRWLAWLVAGSSALLWAADHLAAADFAYFRAVAPYWEAVVRFGFYAAFILTLTTIKRSLAQLREKNEETRAALAALHETEQRYREVFDYSSSGVVLLDVTPDLRFRVVTANPAAERMIGVPAAEMKSRFVEEVLPAGPAEELIANYRRCVQAGHPISVDGSIEFPSGRRIFHTTLIPVKDGRGRVHRIIALPIDMTAENRAVEALRQSEEKFSKAFHASPDSITISRLSDGVILEVNPGFTEANGYSREEAIGRSSLPGDLGIWVKAEEREKWARMVSEKGEVTAFEATFRSRNGAFREGLLSSRIVEIEGEQCLLTISRDVTDRKRMEEALRESEARYREIFENTSDGIFVVEVTPDQRFRLLSYNPAQERMLGIPSASAVGRFSDEYLPAEFAARVNEDNRRCIEAGRPMSFEEALDLPWGRAHYYTTLVPVRDMDGRIARLIGVTRDMTERKRSEEREREHERQLFQAAKLASLGTLVSGIAHEINNPNNFIRLNSQNLKELWGDVRQILDQAGEKEDLVLHGIPLETAKGMVEDLLGGIEEGSKRIEKLLVNLRDFARGDEGDLGEEVDVNAVIGSAVMITANLIRKSTDSFSVSETPGLPRIRGNYHQIEQVLINLVTNACQALPSRGRAVKVATRAEDGGGWVLVEVEDEGVGIPSQNIAQVTDPFFTTKRARGGSGLGLAVSSRIITNHGGTMSFSSEVGRGTRVTVRLPAAGGPR